ncbi:hypothetical protein HX869_30720 [Pseudomonas sp. P7779]|uniref:hypothetical protein n=1 Tax=Pseudomonas sp. P7779 TaxID=2738832 RepID=UPI0015BD168C|nr:hypothetical protein [Pseudomonas sp. P7779]NWD03150.1 hypothetical protein [Pseudomonas sp. P7779]
MIFLMSLQEFLNFLKRYFPTFMMAIYAQIFTFAFGIPLMFDSYFKEMPVGDNLRYSFFTGLGLALLASHCNFMIACGYPGWVWIPVVLMILCLLGVLPTIDYRPHKVFYVLSILFPLLALLLLNSKRHREVRSEWVKLRQKRHRVIAIIRGRRRKKQRQSSA